MDISQKERLQHHFYSYGKGIKSKVILEKGRLIDEGPTLTSLL